jgi:hypothetical protein
MNRTLPRILALLLALTFMLAACRRADDNNGGTPSPSPNASLSSPPPGTVSTPMPTPRPEWVSTFRVEELYTVYVCVMESLLDMWADSGRCLSLTTELAQRAGFPLEFIPHPPPMMSEPAVFGQFLGESTKAIAIMLPHDFDRYFSQEAGDLFDDIWERSPERAMYSLAYNQAILEKDGVYAIPIDSQHRPQNLAILIRNDVYREYGREIRSASDYEALLRWLRRQGWDGAAPGVALPMITPVAGIANTDWQRNMAQSKVMALDLFLPEMGYIRFPAWQTHMSIHWWFNTWLAPDGQIVEFYETDSTAIALTRFLDWRQDGLLDITAGSDNLKNYPTILTNIDQVLSLGFQGFIDAAEYTVNVLPQPVLSTSSVNFFAVAAPGTDIGVFLDFLLWLEDRDNYIGFRYGEEHVHYARDGNRIVLDPDNYLLAPNMIFANYEHDLLVYNPSMHGERLPAGYHEEVGAIAPFASPFTLETAIQARDAVRDAGGWQFYQPHTHINSFLNHWGILMSSFYTVLYDIYFGDDMTPARIYDVFDALQFQAEVLGIAGVFSGIANEALGVY